MLEIDITCKYTSLVKLFEVLLYNPRVFAKMKAGNYMVYFFIVLRIFRGGTTVQFQNPAAQIKGRLRHML